MISTEDLYQKILDLNTEIKKKQLELECLETEYIKRIDIEDQERQPIASQPNDKNLLDGIKDNVDVVLGIKGTDDCPYSCPKCGGNIFRVSSGNIVCGCGHVLDRQKDFPKLTILTVC